MHYLCDNRLIWISIYIYTFIMSAILKSQEQTMFVSKCEVKCPVNHICLIWIASEYQQGLVQPLLILMYHGRS